METIKNDIVIYKLLPHLPPPPQWLINQIDFNLCPTVNNIGGMGQRQLVDWKGYTGPATRNTLRVFNDEYINWVRDNITDDFHAGMINYCQGTPTRTSTGAHTDFTRDWLLLYNVRRGGPDASLCFWQEKNQPLIRPRQTEVGEYHNLELINEIPGPDNVWYLLNTRVLHSSENVTELRLNLQISFDSRFPKELV